MTNMELTYRNVKRLDYILETITEYSIASFSPLHSLVIKIWVNFQEGCGKEVRINYTLSVLIFTQRKC